MTNHQSQLENSNQIHIRPEQAEGKKNEEQHDNLFWMAVTTSWASVIVYSSHLCIYFWADTVIYRVIPGHRNHVFDPASVFLSTHWWSQHPACQRCFYKPFRNCSPASEFRARGKRRGFSPGAAARHSQYARVYTEFVQKPTFFGIFLSSSWGLTHNPHRNSNSVARDFVNH